jgi:hypothetical protein
MTNFINNRVPLLLCQTLAVTLSFPALAQTALRVHGDPQIGLTVPQGATGFDWDHAFRYLNDAIDAAESGDSIWIAGSAEGIHYYPDKGEGVTEDDPEAHFRLPDAVEILGGFQYGDDAATDRNPLLNRVILNGDLQQDDGVDFANYDDNAYHVVIADGVPESAVLDGVTVRGGYARLSTSHPVANGGGLLLETSEPKIIGCTIIENQAGANGGGIATKVPNQTVPEIRNCIIRKNRSIGDSSLGGGVYVVESIDLIACRIEDNFTSTVNANGGGVVGGTGTMNIYNCVLIGNYAPHGGAIQVSASSFATVRLANSLVVQNTALEGAGAQIGGQTVVEITNCTFADNQATSTASSTGGRPVDGVR